MVLLLYIQMEVKNGIIVVYIIEKMVQQWKNQMEKKYGIDMVNYIVQMVQL